MTPQSPTLARKVYGPLGFSKAYNCILWFIFGSTFLAFVLLRLQYLNFDIFCPTSNPQGSGAAPGECYYYRNFDWYKIGINLHLYGVLPASLIVVLQFTPLIRHHAILVHRIGGYVALLLWTLSAIGALMVARVAFGGEVDVQTWVAAAIVGTSVCFVLAIISIKRLQIEQHRSWMLRGWFIVCWLLLRVALILTMAQAGAVVTGRVILLISASIIPSTNSYYMSWPCAKIAFVLNTYAEAEIISEYPSCAAFFEGTDVQQEAVVRADFNGAHATEIGAALDMKFGSALWIATILHIVCVEIYVSWASDDVLKSAHNTLVAPHMERRSESAI
jgi:hypothetical protein